MNDKLLAIGKKLLALLLSVLIPVLAAVISFDPVAKYEDDVQAALEKSGGVIKGVCHADPDYELIKEAGISWTRKDIPFLYDHEGNISQSYLNWKAEMQAYADNGIKVFAITPYPYKFLEYGIDPRTPEGKIKVQETAEYYARDLAGIVGAFQVTNEMGIDRFTLPLTIDEAADYIGYQLEVMYPICKENNILLGYNIADFTLPFKMLKYNDYLDYVGLDLYLGCFEDILHEIETFEGLAGLVHHITGKPIIYCEFGYMGYGEPKTEEEKIAVLQKYGYNSEAEATADMDNFIQKLPKDMKEEIIELYGNSGYTAEQYADMIFRGEYMNHFYTSLPEGYYLDGYTHTPEGQAKFFETLIPRLLSKDYIIGTIIYCWSDSDRCYVCGQSDCPVETGWGLVDGQGNPKPSYYAVQKAFTESDR